MCHSEFQRKQEKNKKEGRKRKVQQNQPNLSHGEQSRLDQERISTSKFIPKQLS